MDRVRARATYHWTGLGLAKRYGTTTATTTTTLLEGSRGPYYGRATRGAALHEEAARATRNAATEARLGFTPRRGTYPSLPEEGRVVAPHVRVPELLGPVELLAVRRVLKRAELPVRLEDAIEVIELVLEDDGGEALEAQRHGRRARVGELDANVSLPPDEDTRVRHAEARFEPRDARPDSRRDAWIDAYPVVRDGRHCCRAAPRPRHPIRRRPPHDKRTEVRSHLRGCESEAVFGGARCDEICKELKHFGGEGRRDRHRFRSQYAARILDDRPDDTRGEG